MSKRKRNQKGAQTRPAARSPLTRWSPLILVGMAAVVFVLWKELAPVPTPVQPADLSRIDSEVRLLLERELEEALAHPGRAEAHGELGMLYEANGLLSEAARSYHNASKLDGANPLWRLHEGIARARLGHFDEALALFESVRDDRACAAAAYYRIGQVLLEQAQLDAAEENFRAALRRASTMAEPHVGLASVLLRKRDYAGAQKELEKALKIDPDHKQGHYLLGMAYRGLGRMDEARKELARGIVSDRRFVPDPLSPRVAAYRVNIASQLDQAQALIRAGNPDGMRILERLHQRRPQDTNVINNLAIALMESGQHPRALGLLRRARSARPADFPTRINLASCLFSMQQYDEALEHAAQASTMAPEVASSYMIRGKILAVQNRLNDAYPLLKRGIRLDAGDPDGQFLLGEVCAATGRYPEAKLAFEMTTRLNPQHLMAHVKLCRVCVELGEFRQAEAELVAAQRISPDANAVKLIRELVAKRTNQGAGE